MSKIIYQPSGKDDQYLIDEDEQQLLAYLYLYGPAGPHELVDHLNYQDSEKLIELIKDKFYSDDTSLIEIRESDQLNLDRNIIPEISLTKEGKKLVKNFRFEITPPFSVHSYIHEMRKIEGNIQNNLKSIIDRAEYYHEEERASENIESLMKEVENYFDDIRENQI